MPEKSLPCGKIIKRHPILAAFERPPFVIS